MGVILVTYSSMKRDEQHTIIHIDHETIYSNKKRIRKRTHKGFKIYDLKYMKVMQLKGNSKTS